MIVFVNTLNTAGFHLDNVELHITKNVDSIVKSTRSDDLFQFMRLTFGACVPKETDAHRLCAQLGVTWGDMAIAFVKN